MLTDQFVKEKWNELGDIPTYEDKDSILYIDEDFYIWTKGTDLSKIWHWFDDNYSLGLHTLMFSNPERYINKWFNEN